MTAPVLLGSAALFVLAALLVFFSVGVERGCSAFSGGEMEVTLWARRLS